MDGILRYHIPPEKEDYTVSEADPAAMDIDPQLLGVSDVPAGAVRTRSNLRLFTPPLFSRQGIPQNYKCVDIECTFRDPCTKLLRRYIATRQIRLLLRT